MAESAPPLLEVRGLAKRFPGVAALKGVDLDGRAGEVHAIVGANGAGKSTLMNILSGAERASAGEIRLDGRPVHFASPSAAQEQGIATVYQEFSLVPQLSVARNVFLGREPTGRLGLVDRERLHADTAALLERYGLRLDPQAEVATLSVAEQQMVELARALSYSARVLILDEPTAVLSLAEQQSLFRIIRGLRAQGLLILYVSHHLSEVLEIADRVTVIRDGSRIGTREAASLTVEALIGLMIGGSGAYERPARTRRQPAGTRFDITYRTGEETASLALRGGEILGLAGLVGAGRTTFARAMAGLPLATARAEVAADGRRVNVGTPRAAMAAGIVYLTEDRKRDGLFAGLDIIANATAAALPRIARGPFRRKGRERALAGEILERLRLVAASLDAPVVTLSGGNQQKVVIGRALLTEPRLLICDEPTRGVDVGAKAEIHEILQGLADRGVAVLVISSEIEELLAVADRIVVMRERRFVAELPAEGASEEAILAAASAA